MGLRPVAPTPFGSCLFFSCYLVMCSTQWSCLKKKFYRANYLQIKGTLTLAEKHQRCSYNHPRRKHWERLRTEKLEKCNPYYSRSAIHEVRYFYSKHYHRHTNKTGQFQTFCRFSLLTFMSYFCDTVASSSAKFTACSTRGGPDISTTSKSAFCSSRVFSSS